MIKLNVYVRLNVYLCQPNDNHKTLYVYILIKNYPL